MSRWEGAQPGSWTKLAKGNIPYHGHHAQFMHGGWPGGQEFSFFHEFDLFREFECFQEFRELWETCRFRDCCSGTGYATCQAVGKMVLSSLVLHVL